VYRIVGRVRLLFFWVSADDVGTARIVWRGDARDRAVSLLIGSEPTHAPRAINEWGYIREQVAGDATTVFGIRTVTDGDTPDEAEANRVRAGRLVEFGVLCSTVSAFEARSRTATVYVPREATYRHAAQVLDVVERQARWNRHGTPRPSDVAPGFLTALDRMMRAGAASAPADDAVPPASRLAYVYKDAVYDLMSGSIQRVSELRTRSGSFRNLLRSEVSIRNRTTGSTTSFSMTYGTEGALAGIPVTVRYQPNWWLRVELELDDHGDAPPDPANDRSISERISAICSDGAAVRTENRQQK
jgi:hypothetical protein